MGLWEITPRRVIFYVLWTAIHVGLFVFGYIKQKDDPELFVLDSLGASVFTSRGAGLVLAFDCALLLLPMCRNLIRYVRDFKPLNFIIPFDYNVYLHKCTAYAMLFFTLIHTNAHYVNFYRVEMMLFDALHLRNWQVHYTTWAGTTGHIMLLFMFLIYTSAKIEVRHRNFEAFWFTHHLAIPFYLLLFYHSFGCFVHSTVTGQCKGYGSNFYTVPVFSIYILERIIRELRARQQTTLSKVIMHPGNTMEIQFEKPSFQYKSGQYLFLSIPEVSKYQWHPFTITSTPEEGFVSLHIRLVGDWTKASAKLLQSYSAQGSILKVDSPRLPTIRVDGPYGAPAEDFYNYETAILIGAGIGVTPAASLLKSVWYRHYRKAQMPLKKVYFFWVNRDKEAFEWFQSLLSSLEESVPTSFLEIHVYLTAKLSSDEIQNIVLHDADGVDPLTELQSRCHFGRPEWNRIFAGVRQAAANSVRDRKHEIGVFYCGPSPLASSLKQACNNATGGNITFTFRKEHF
ncbi:ferric reductase NAD binding domain-containing protein [Polychytrium aggregatum]|uniref:ferric reductase NAD binding domain-containing protein n=1 Tax=Polychytrium aggregatum TaxID=110093 RepID=UPI0022FEF9E0|nr:ferric reductase NAD binding domain-containing protein [Polychytrium aggregatum]KAI9193461.1 ferric reductase NAD binding domain-containing protein [Polychytrium aggregatum]